MSLKNPVTAPGIDPGTVRLVAQRLNHYTIPGPKTFPDISDILSEVSNFQRHTSLAVVYSSILQSA